jgi:hypothetical protein
MRVTLVLLLLLARVAAAKSDAMTGAPADYTKPGPLPSAS